MQSQSIFHNSPVETATNDIVKLAAEKANDYARAQILKGCTQLENNALTENYFWHLGAGIGGSRINQNGIRDVMEQQYKQNDWLERNQYVKNYEANIAITTKYSLGNCEELAIQALDYILTMPNNSHLHAEVYKILNGDHVFLVLNRDPTSNAFDPMTWGDTAYICDPWADKVYPAKDYLKKLTNYYHSNGQNCSEPFNQFKHILSPISFLSTEYMRKERDIHNVLFHFLNESTDVVKILKTYQTDIEQEKNELAQQKGNDKKITILVNKSSDIQRKIDEITTSNLTMMDKIEAIDKEHYQAQYRAIKAELETLLASYYQAAKTVMQFSKASLSTLCKNSNWFSFGETSATHIHLEAITQKTNNILKNKFKHT